MASSSTLTVSVKHLPIEQTSTTPVEGSWRASEPYQPPSPIYAQFTQHRCLDSRANSQTELKASCVASGSASADEPAFFRTYVSPPQSPRMAQVEDSHHLPTTHSPKLPSGEPSSIHYRASSGLQPSAQYKQSPLNSPSLPSFKLLPPLDLNYGPGSKLDSLLEGTTCKCVPPKHSKNPSLCPRNNLPHSPSSISARTHHPPKIVNAVVDPAQDAKRRSLYHSTGSTPHLPYKASAQSVAKSDSSAHSVDSSEADQFPLSLFPLPPPLIVRKKVPAPLVLRATFTASAQSSRDSSPVRTPTTPRLQALNSPSQSNITSPTKKSSLGRPSASFSPPPFSPPDSPLPLPPVSPKASLESTRHSVRPLRMAQSNISLRDPLPFPATHRLTSSEPIPDQSISPARRPFKWRPAERPRNIQAYLQDMKEQSSESGEARIEWGYAF
ncbi:hypothetical protein CVT26_007071 [Gymnopilus dilepis]|uniref:Uncharacterized protein n=1 Tax=Gymnopilus dilepis TaxID=231916 RepID=A0A409VNI6_9AGAR|nr:hypothetical protein CVT26_007071 [Gymnopilus dilepis]